MRIGLLDDQGRRYFPLRKPKAHIGSAEGCQIVLDHPGVAALHAELLITDVGIELHHKGRGHASWVNDRRVSRTLLSNNDRLRFGELVMTFLLRDEAGEPGPVCRRCGVALPSASTCGAPRTRCDRCRNHAGGSQAVIASRPESSRFAGGDDPFGVADLFTEDPARDDTTELKKVLEDIPKLKPLTLIDRGAQGDIYKMEYEGHTVAVKRIQLSNKAQAKERFQRELEALRRVDHPSLARLIHAVQSGSHASLVMEFIDGPSLAKLLTRDGALPLSRTLRYADQVAEGLAHLEQVGIIHRDVKPANILIGADDQARLVDFGLVRFISKDTMLTNPGQLVGSPTYMSPEQIRAQDISAKSDVFSLGVTLFECLCGHRPFQGVTPLELFNNILSNKLRLEPLRCFGPDIERLLSAMLEKSPERRPSATQAQGEIAKIIRSRLQSEPGDPSAAR
jgi:serine/threonine protein kinase